MYLSWTAPSPRSDDTLLRSLLGHGGVAASEVRLSTKVFRVLDQNRCGRFVVVASGVIPPNIEREYEILSYLFSSIDVHI